MFGLTLIVAPPRFEDLPKQGLKLELHLGTWGIRSRHP
jgi:hypothetical protein